MVFNHAMLKFEMLLLLLSKVNSFLFFKFLLMTNNKCFFCTNITNKILSEKWQLIGEVLLFLGFIISATFS